jgi:O-antigen/teichoic acid export membrane protein
VKRRLASWLTGTQLRRNVVSGTLTSVGSSALVLVSYPVYLGHLGLETYGVWLVLSSVIALAQLGNFGISQAMTKYAAEGQARCDYEGIESRLSTGVALLVGVGVVAFVSMTVGRGALVSLLGLSPQLGSLSATLLPYVALLSGLMLVTQAYIGLLAGLGRFDQSNYIQLAGKAIALAVSWMMLAAGAELAGLLMGSALAQLLMQAWAVRATKRAAPISSFRWSGVTRQKARELLGFGGAVFGASVVNWLLHPLNRVLLTRYSGATSTTVFEVAYSGTMQIRALGDSGIRAVMPEFSRANAAGLIGSMATLNRKTTRLIWLGAGPLYALLWVGSPTLLQLWLGSAYVSVQGDVFRVMLLGSFLSLLAVPAYYYLLGVGMVRAVLMSHVIQTGTSLAVVIAALLLKGRLQAVTVAAGVSAGFLASFVYVRQARSAHLAESKRNKESQE